MFDTVSTFQMLQVSPSCSHLIATLRIYDCDGEDDSQKKNVFILLSNFAFIEMYSVCLSVLKLAPAKYVTNAFSSKQKHEKLAVVVHVLLITQNLVISRCCLQKTAKKCTKNYNARAQLLFCSSNLLFADKPIVRCLCLRLLRKVPIGH